MRREAEDVPGAAWRARCRGGRVQLSPSHADFPTLLAEALDVIAAAEADVKAAAAELGCTSSQLIKLLQKEPRALPVVNQWRQQRGLRRLASC